MQDKEEYYTKDGTKKITIESTNSDGGGCLTIGAFVAFVVGLLLVLYVFFLSPIISAFILGYLVSTKGWTKKNIWITVAWFVLTLTIPSLYHALFNRLHWSEIAWLAPIIQIYYPLAGLGALLIIFFVATDYFTKNNPSKTEPVSNPELENGSQDVEDLFGGG